MFGGTEEGKIKFLFSPATLKVQLLAFVVSHIKNTLNSLNDSVTISVAFNHDNDICFHGIVTALDDSMKII